MKTSWGVLKPRHVTANLNLICFGGLCRSAIDHSRCSRNYGQCVIGRVVNSGAAGTAGIKAGEPPEAWDAIPAKQRQKDVDARLTKKNNETHYGYKNHINADEAHKLVQSYAVSDAAVHDSHRNCTPQ